MKTPLVVLVLSLTSMVFLKADEPSVNKSKAVKDEVARLQGDWKIEQAKYSGFDFTPDKPFPLIRISGQKVGSVEGGKIKNPMAFKLYPDRKPKAFDAIDKTGGKTRVYKYIYRLDGDELTIAGPVSFPGDELPPAWKRERPSSFDTKSAPGLIRVVFKRAKSGKNQ